MTDIEPPLACSGSFEELEEIFNEAANVVQAYTTGMVQSSKKPSDSQLLGLYGLYKVATTGPCKEPQPGIFNLKARSKWSAWKERSDKSKTEAMELYIRQVMEIYDWGPSECSSEGGTKGPSGGFAPAVSRPHVEEEEEINDQNTPFGWIKDNDTQKLTEWVTSGDADTNLCDEDGLSLLHWAADRGRREACEILLKGGANPELKDEDGQTPLDYAITCEHDDIIKLLEKAQEAKDTS